jgi:DNA-binding winged helix-turn-helix (wHTH) protein
MSKYVYVFAEFAFDPETGTLTRRNRDVRLPEQAALLLGSAPEKCQ